MVQMCCGDATNVAQRQPCLMHPYEQTNAVAAGHGQSASRRQASEILGEHTPPSHRESAGKAGCWFESRFAILGDACRQISWSCDDARRTYGSDSLSIALWL